MIEIKNLTKKFKTSHGTLTVFDAFNLAVKDGTFLGVQGKSGAGKSTLLSLLAGLQKPDSGSITVDGIEITALDEKQLAAFRNRSVGYISQEQSFLENLTVFDNVRLPAYISQNKPVLLNLFQHFPKSSPEHSAAAGVQPVRSVQNDADVIGDTEIAARANKLLADLGIAHLANQYPQDLSGGENHRVLIARALINNPKLILADEPTDSVDSDRTTAIITLFKELARTGKTVILVSHDDQALRLCDEVVVIH
ncbi:MAG: ABC transporter ATP-binding protein [Spirochaetales bacterium]|nr:ABC transporter ATP-binding protein [Spirochaetales bacterium]